MTNVRRLSHTFINNNKPTSSLGVFMKPFVLLLALLKALSTRRHQPFGEEVPNLKQCATALPDRITLPSGALCS